MERMKDLTQQYVEQLENMVKDLREKKLELEEENKKLKEERDLYKARNEELNEDCFGLANENKKLKSDLAFERNMLDNVRAEYEISQKEIRKLKAQIEKMSGIGLVSVAPTVILDD